MRRGLMNAGQAFHLKLAAIALTTSTAIVGIAWPRMSASKILPARWRGKSRGAGTDQLNRPGDNNRSQLTCNRRSAMESRVFLPSAVVAVLLGAAVGAQAADLPVASQSRNSLSAAATSPYDWTGFYVGAQIGYGWGQSSGTQNAGGTFFPVVPYSLDPAGALAGGHVGFAYQTGAIVLGAEADLEAANLNGSTSFPAFNQTYFFNAKADTLASVRGRFGWAQDWLMLYGTAGAAWGRVTTPPLDGLNGWRTGWTAGAGVEYAVRRNWSVKAEYRYTDLGRASSFDPTLNSTDDNKLNFHAIRLGASYRFPAAQ